MDLTTEDIVEINNILGIVGVGGLTSVEINVVNASGGVLPEEELPPQYYQIAYTSLLQRIGSTNGYTPLSQILKIAESKGYTINTEEQEKETTLLIGIVC